MKKLLSTYTPNEWVILLLFLAAFTHVYIMVGALILVPVYFLATRQAKLALPANVGEYFLLAFSILAVIATLFAKNAIWDPETSSFLLKSYYLKILSVLIVILCFDVFFITHVITKKSLADGLKLCGAMSYFCFIVAVAQKLTGAYAGTAPDRVGRVASVFHNENYYGVAVECLVLIGLFLFIHSKGWKVRLFYAGSILVNFAGLWLSGCRTAFLVTAVCVMIFLCVFDYRFIAPSVALIVIGVLLIRFVPALLPRFEALKDNFDFRAGIWKAAFRAFLDRPWIGRGYFSYSGIWDEYSHGTYFAIHAHNLYLEVLLNFGVFGTVGLFGYSGSQLIKSVKACVKTRKRGELALVLSVLAALLLHGILDTTFFWPQTGAFFAMILAASKAYRETEPDKS